jgi:DNA-binding MarR family transcriptional regulator
MARDRGPRALTRPVANAVAERTAMDKVAVSRAVAHLLERGLLTREMHGDDRRRSVLTLSPKRATRSTTRSCRSRWARAQVARDPRCRTNASSSNASSTSWRTKGLPAMLE